MYKNELSKITKNKIKSPIISRKLLSDNYEENTFKIY